MKKWVQEDWRFTVEVVSGRPEKCRLGLEPGDRFACEYGCPVAVEGRAGFCPKTMGVLYAYCEIIRCGGDFLARGGTEPYVLEFPCADGPVRFRLTAHIVNT